MRKTELLILFSLLLWGCEKTYDTVINTSTDNYQVTSVSPSDSVTFNPFDSLIIVKIDFTSESEVDVASFEMIASNGTKLNSTSVSLFDNGNPANGDVTAGDNSFANKFPMSSYYPIGNYQIKFYVEQSDGTNKQVALSNFKYRNQQVNIAPVISNSVIEPDTVVVTQPTVIFTSIEASDPNGNGDIGEVYFIVFKPDGSTNNSKLNLFDDGNIEEHGDSTAGDNKYSRLILVNQTNDKGTYRFEFRAKDRSDSLSNIINHFVLIQ